jgi:hypothetical protein
MDNLLEKILSDDRAFDANLDDIETFLELERRRAAVESGEVKCISMEEHFDTINKLVDLV